MALAIKKVDSLYKACSTKIPVFLPKNFNRFFSIRFFLIFFLPVILIGCEKEKEELKWDLSFNYNGKRFHLGRPETSETGSPLWPYGGAIGAHTEWDYGEDYLWINRPDIFKGIIKYKGPDCGFVYPYPLSSMEMHAVWDVCEPNLINASVSSAPIYFFKSGFVTYKSEKCLTKTFRAFFSSSNFPQTQTTCNYFGTFELEFVNSAGQIIQLTKGEYKRINH